MISIDRRSLFAGGAGMALLAAARAKDADAAAPAAKAVVSARDFGAVGDGNADDSAALQKTFEAALDGSAAKMVVIPPGRYRVTRPIRIQTRDRPHGNITHRAGILAQGATLVSSIADGQPVIDIESRATVRYFLIEGLTIKGSGRDGHGLSITCQKRGRYFYNFCLRDLVIEGCGGDGCHMIGNLFEGQIFNSYFRDNKSNGATFGHGAEDTVLSAVHVFGCVFGGNGRHGAEMIKGAVDVGFQGCYFLLNQHYGLSAGQGCTLLSHCGFENNHQRAKEFEQGNAGLRLMVAGTLIGCTSYSIYSQTHLVRAFVTNRLVMVGCTGEGGGKAKRAGLAAVKGKNGASATLVGCTGRVDRDGPIDVLEFGTKGSGARFGSRWDSANLAWIGDYSLWIDKAGRLRIKKGEPKSDDDGRAVGA